MHSKPQKRKGSPVREESSSKRPTLQEASTSAEFSSDPSKVINEPTALIEKLTTIKALMQAFEGRIKSIRLNNDDNFTDIGDYLESKRKAFLELISEELEKTNLKVNVLLMCLYDKLSSGGVVTEEKNFKTRNCIIVPSTDLNEVFDNKKDKLLAESSEFEEKDSGWTLSKILYLEVRINKYNPLHGSTFIKLPEFIEKKKAVINVRNNDSKCFMWSVLAALHPQIDNAHRVEKYATFVNELDFSGLEFPIKLQDVFKFENKNNISINVYGFNVKNIFYPLYITKKEKEVHIDLLFITSLTTSHYCYVKNLSRLLTSQYSSHDGKKFICRRCLQFFTAERNLNEHRLNCDSHEAVRVLMPTEKEKWIHFKNFKHIHKIPFVIYADFECLTKPIASCCPNSQSSYTELYQKHEAISFCYYVSYFGKEYKPPVVSRGADAVPVFMRML
nr:uncharacterized protein LOC107451906 [Parasteatoda tepidariorum]